MFKGFSKKAEASRQEYKRRKELVTDVAKLIQHDTDRVIDAKQIALEDSIFSSEIGLINESHYADIRDRYGISDPLRTTKGLSDQTLMLLQERFSADSSGINQLVRDARTAVGDKEIFYRERLMYPAEFRGSRIETSRTYRETRYALQSKDMSTLPVEHHSGVMAVLKVGSFWGDHLMINQVEMRLSGDTRPPQELVNLLFKMPERVDDIIDYILNRKISLEDIEFDHMRDVLTTESKPFGIGVL
jgi:hypothetical protein